MILEFHREFTKDTWVSATGVYMHTATETAFEFEFG